MINKSFISSFEKDGFRCVFLVNEGKGEIHKKVKVMTCGAVTAIDLWSGNVRQFKTVCESGKAEIILDLKYRESVLLILDCKEIENMQECKEKHNYIQLPFKLVQDNREELQKVYEAEWNCTEIDKNFRIKVQAEEMAECFVNDKFAGVSFWNRHEFCLSPYLGIGKNKVKLIITGNLANRYSDKSVFYGLKDVLDDGMLPLC